MFHYDLCKLSSAFMMKMLIFLAQIRTILGGDPSLEYFLLLCGICFHWEEEESVCRSLSWGWGKRYCGAMSE